MERRWKFASIKWFLITIFSIFCGYRLGENMMAKLFMWIFETFGHTFTETQFERVHAFYYSSHFVVIFFAMFCWMFAVCVTLVIENIIAKLKKTKA